MRNRSWIWTPSKTGSTSSNHCLTRRANEEEAIHDFERELDSSRRAPHSAWMAIDGDNIVLSSAGSPDFRTTHWSAVLLASGSDSEGGLVALDELCQTYWYPLYAFVRRQGYDARNAEDLTQGFFARMLSKHGLASVRPEHGRFRSFLLASLKNYIANEWDREHALKRGGKETPIHWEEQVGEGRYLQEPFHDSTPETLFEQSWALTLIQRVMDQLKFEYSKAGKSALFEGIYSYLEEEGAETYGALAADLGMSEGAVKMAVLRLRDHFRQALREQIAKTVGEAREVEEEIRHLFVALGR